MHLFLQGDIGIGKSTILRRALAQRGIMPGGFMTQRLLEESRIIGFRGLILRDELPPLQTPYSPDMEGIFLLKGRYKPEVLPMIIGRLEQESLRRPKPLLLLDEIGGIELADPVFSECLRRILLRGIPCLGVLKSAANLAHTIRVLELEGKYQALHEDLVRLISENGQLLTVGSDNREEISRHVESYLAKTK